jgi:NAD(P)-dependent dehydrogenase (short-subunit alcohol dehydrogenase family)
VKKYQHKHQIISLNRKGFSEKYDVEHHNFDVLHDEFPIKEQFDSLVYFPGSINLKPFKNLTNDDFKNDMDINFNGAVKCIKNSLPLLNKNGLSSIVLFSTIAVAQGMSFHASIASAKGAVEALAKSLAAEFAPHIRVNVIALSITDTPLASKILGNEKGLENSKNRHPLKKVGHPDDIATMVDFLISNEAQWITGQIFRVDGGLSTIKAL